VQGARGIIQQAAEGDFPSLPSNIDTGSPHAVFGALLVRACQADRWGMVAAADALKDALASPRCEPFITRMYGGVPELGYAAAGTTDPAEALASRRDAWVTQLKRQRLESSTTPGVFIDILGLALPAVGLRAGIEFPHINPYTPLTLIHPTLEDRDVVHA
jgi:hypothetical protein